MRAGAFGVYGPDVVRILAEAAVRQAYSDSLMDGDSMTDAGRVEDKPKAREATG